MIGWCGHFNLQRAWDPRMPTKSIEVVRWGAMEEDKVSAAAVVKQSFEEHDPQLYLALALLCKGSALVKVKNTEVNIGLEAWRRIERYVLTVTTKVGNEYGCSTCYNRHVPSRCCRLKGTRDGNVT